MVLRKRLEKVRIKGFKSIKLLQDFHLTNLNVFIGANGSGKSNFIDFFRLLRAMMCLPLPNLISTSLDSYTKYYGGSEFFLFNGIKTTNKIDIEIYFTDNEYKFTLSPTIEKAFLIYNECQRFTGLDSNAKWRNFRSKGVSEPELLKDKKTTTKEFSTSKYIYDAISSLVIYHFHDTTDTSGMRRFSDIVDKKKLRFDGSNIASYLFYLKCDHPLCYEKIQRYIQLIAPFFDDFVLEKGFEDKEQIRLLWRHKGSDYILKPSHLSDGTIRFICLATALLQPNLPSLIIIDEPELGLHPFAINVLAELIKSASENSQIIVTTQSPRLIDNFSANDIITVNRKDGESIFERLDENNFKDWLEDYSLGELWVKNIIEARKVYETFAGEDNSA